MQLVLASQSPRRKELLGYFDYPFTIQPSHYDEESHPWNGDPEVYACELSEAKAKAVTLTPDSLILAADTIVYCEGRLFGKATSLEEAREFMRSLAGKWHHIFTGVTVRSTHALKSRCEESRVRIHPLTDAQIDIYLNSIIWQDKAGAYAIQGAGGFIVKEIEGCYYNIVGLPLALTAELLNEQGIDLWKHFKPERKG